MRGFGDWQLVTEKFRQQKIAFPTMRFKVQTIRVVILTLQQNILNLYVGLICINSFPYISPQSHPTLLCKWRQGGEKQAGKLFLEDLGILYLKKVHP